MGLCTSAAKAGVREKAKVSERTPPTEVPAVPPALPKAGQRWRGLEVCSVYPLGSEPAALLVISAGSVVDFEGDAIVNAANEGCISGGGVDGAITAAGGPEMAQARLELPVVDPGRAVRCPTGEARVTIGGALKVPFCIHAVGPDYSAMVHEASKSLQECDALVSKTYKSALECAREKAVGTVAFSLISSSICRGPQSLQNVLAAGIAGIQSGVYPALREVHLVAFTQTERMVLEQLCGEMFPYAEGTLGGIGGAVIEEEPDRV